MFALPMPGVWLLTRCVVAFAAGIVRVSEMALRLLIVALSVLRALAARWAGEP